MSFTEEQLKAINSRNENLLVSAAAGSGKTTVLVERIMSLVTDENAPVDIGDILVVTFTRAAAANMKDKIAKAFRERLEKEGRNPRLLRQSILVHRAKIMTLDTFCLSVIRDHFPETGLDPGFRVAAEGEAELIKGDVFSNVMEEYYLSDDNYDFLDMCEALSAGRDDSGVESVVRSLWRVAESYPWPLEWLEDHKCDYDSGDETAKEYYVNQAESRLTYMETLLSNALAICDEPEGPVNYRDSVNESLFAVRTALMKLKETGEFTEEDAERISFPRISGRPKNVILKDMAAGLRKEAQKQAKDLKELAASYRVGVDGDPVCGRHLKALINLTERVMEEYAAEKERRGVIDFSDMGHTALRILARKNENGEIEPTETALEYRKAFREVMCDEYQDSNLVQELILSVIAGDDPTVCNRFMVGDVKQSIYAFRQARPELFVKKYEEYGLNERGTDLRVILSQNFRSRRTVTDSVNQVFEVIMKKAFGGVEYDENARLTAAARYSETDSEENRTELLVASAETDEEADGSGDSDRAELESLCIAHRIRDLMRAFKVSDGSNDSVRPVRYGDMAVLVRSLGENVNSLRRILEENGIPVSVTTSTGYFSALEVRTLMNYLETLGNPLDDIPLFGTMRGLLGGFDDDELALIKASVDHDSPLWEAVINYAFGERSELQDKTLLFVRKIERYREMSVYTPVSGILRKLLNETGYRELVSAMSGGARRFQNVQMLVKKAEEYEKTSYSGVRDFVRYIAELKKYSVDFGEADAEGEDSDAVRIMTIHKSKGLEFPVVFLSFTGKQFNDTDLKGKVVINPDLGVGMDHVDTLLRLSCTTLRKEAVISRIHDTTHGEELRLLYTAMTRAKEKLVITGSVKDAEKLLSREQRDTPDLMDIRSKKTYLDWLMMTPIALRAEIFTPKGEEQRERMAFESLNERKKAVLYGDMVDDSVYRSAACALEYQYPHPELKGKYSKTTVTELKKLSLEEEGESVFPESPEPKEMPSDYPVPAFLKEGSRPLPGTFRGTAYHRVMAVMDFEAPDVNEELLRLERTGLISLEQRRSVKVRDIEAFRGSPVFERMKQAFIDRKLKRELPFVTTADSVSAAFPPESSAIIQGMIDAMWEEEDGTVILDYKTDRVRDMEELKERYHLQLELYGKAMDKRRGRKKVKALILYSFPLAEAIEL